MDIPIDRDELLFADAFLKENFPRIKDWVIGDIRRCSRMDENGVCADNGSLIGAFILWCCALDYYGGLLSGVYSPDASKKKVLHHTKERIRQFVTKYLTRYGEYEYQKLYDFRSTLLHFYSPKHYVLEHDQNKRTFHLKQTNRGRILHLGSCIEDIEQAVTDYEKDLWQKPSLRIKAFRYYKIAPMIMPLDFAKLRIIEGETF